MMDDESSGGKGAKDCRDSGSFTGTGSVTEMIGITSISGFPSAWTVLSATNG